MRLPRQGAQNNSENWWKKEEGRHAKKYEKKETKIDNERKNNKTNKQTKVTNSVKRGPSWKAACSVASREFSRNLRNPKVHYRVHRSSPVGTTGELSWARWTQSTHPPPSYFFKTHFNIIVPSSPRSYKCLIFLQVLLWKPFINSSFPCTALTPCQSHPPWLDNLHNGTKLRSK